ncbi:MAG: type II secretion system protein N [Paenalcaligenes sp.]
MTRILLILMAALTFAGGFLVAAPASWLQVFMPAFLQLNVSEGTLWKGSSQLIVNTQHPQALPSRIHWQWNWTPWPQLQITSNDLAQPLLLSLSGTRLSLSQSRLQLPASLLSSAHPLLASLQPHGNLSITWPTFYLGASTPVDISVRWQNAAVTVASLRPLGSYALDLQLADSTTLQLRTEQGPLQLSGQGSFGPKRPFSFKGEASSSPEYTAALQPLLHLLGPVQNGRASFSLQAAP